MKRLLGLLLSIALTTGVLTGCNGIPGESSGTNSLEDAPTVSNTSTLEINDGEETAWPRTYVDSKGKEVVLKQKPEHVVVVMGFYAENFFALDEYPIACAGIEGFLGNFATWQPFLSDESNPIENIGEIATPNMEQIVELEPDLIIVSEANDDVYEDLTKIAPVISITQSDMTTWKDQIIEFSKILGKETEAEAYISKFESDVQSYREQLSTRLNSETVLFIQAGDKNTFYLRTPDYFSQFYNSDSGLGLSAPAGYTNDTGGTASLEGLAELNPDHIFYMSDTAGNYKTVYEEMSDNSVWNSLKAVKNGHVYFIDQGAISGGALAARYGIDTVFEALNK